MNPALDTLIQTDQEVFLWLNGWHSPFWDAIMKGITYKFTWIPLYLLLMYAMVSTFQKKAIGMILCIIAVVALSDQVASAFLKPYFMRPRPCHDTLIGDLVQLVGNCGGAYGFVSSHAATSFGIAAAVNLLPTSTLRGASWLWAWAILYSYSRIYVGVHYPLDILGGGLVGIGASLLCVGVYRYAARRSTSTFM